jgi:hypothetical protein
LDDQQLWHFGAMRLKGLYAAISADSVAELKLFQLLNRYQTAKEAIASLVAHVDSAAVCLECRGQCCLNGKYRISVFDLLARLAAQIPTPADFARKPLCPYGADDGCIMAPGLRPADCVLFICDSIDRKLTAGARILLAEQEQSLREALLEASRLTGERMGSPLLLWAENAMRNPN